MLKIRRIRVRKMIGMILVLGWGKDKGWHLLSREVSKDYWGQLLRIKMQKLQRIIQKILLIAKEGSALIDVNTILMCTWIYWKVYMEWNMIILEKCQLSLWKLSKRRKMRHLRLSIMMSYSPKKFLNWNQSLQDAALNATLWKFLKAITALHARDVLHEWTIIAHG